MGASSASRGVVPQSSNPIPQIRSLKPARCCGPGHSEGDAASCCPWPFPRCAENTVRAKENARFSGTAPRTKGLGPAVALPLPKVRPRPLLPPRDSGRACRGQGTKQEIQCPTLRQGAPGWQGTAGHRPGAPAARPGLPSGSRARSPGLGSSQPLTSLDSRFLQPGISAVLWR